MKNKITALTLLEFIQQNCEESLGNKLGIFEKLIAENQQFDLQVPIEINLSELANEVNR